MSRRSRFLVQVPIAVAVFFACFFYFSTPPGRVLSARMTATLRGGSTTDVPARTNCIAFNGFASVCVGQPDNTDCNSCSEKTREGTYLQFGGPIDPPGFNYSGVGPPLLCGILTAGACMNQVCFAPTPTEIQCTHFKVIGLQN